MHGWTQRALVGTFMGGLKSEIADEIRLFRPQTLKEVMGLARMRDEQLVHQRKASKWTKSVAEPTLNKTKSPNSIRKLSWDELQKHKREGACFHYGEKYVVGNL